MLASLPGPRSHLSSCLMLLPKRSGSGTPKAPGMARRARTTKRPIKERFSGGIAERGREKIQRRKGCRAAANKGDVDNRPTQYHRS